MSGASVEPDLVIGGLLKPENSPALRRFKPYPAYKDSGVEWLGKIPEHWDVRRLKTIASVHLSNVDKKTLEGQEPVRLCNYVDVYYNERITSNLDLMAATATPDQIERFSLRAGDVLVTKDSESWTDIAVPAVVAEDIPDALCGYHLAHIRPGTNCYGPFLARAFAAIGPRNQFEVAANGITRYGLGGDTIRAGVFAMPPAYEQRAIATFLDRETERIDALVAKKEQLLALLQEQRTALITCAVTRGLDSNTPMKDSGIEWLGNIPAHWEVKRTKFAARLRSGHTPSRQHPEYWQDCTIPWFGLADVWQIRDGRTEYVSETNEKISELGLANSAARLLPRGTVIVSRTASVGFSAIMAADMATTQDFVNWVCGPSLRPEYLLYVFRAMEHEFNRLTMGSTHQTIYMPDVGRFTTPIPPLADQDQIVAWIRQEAGGIDALTDKVRGAIERLRELRTAIISAAVTGKIDVQGDLA